MERKFNPEYDSETNTKICAGACGLRKSIDEFSPVKRGTAGIGGVAARCRACLRVEGRERSRTLSTNEKLSIYLHKYGLTLQDYNTMLETQNYKCDICKLPEQRKHNSGVVYNLVVDHDHSTGKVRALLCHKCNVGIGAFDDDPALIKEAIKYLQKER